MVALLRRLTNLSVVPKVLQTPMQYPSTRNGFIKDRRKLQGDTDKITHALNKNIYKYGKKYSSQS